ncbi:hypothetical protein SteCoe_26046 [Stentor coeruleus]|uniref:UBL3-like ubiquitin domain-containing protein n=1 Tax=Stentor coeruleus TaxID=5963 RepID=A0A1R2BDV7_9CILI|nr:hypothetical protein SteCoe_26046 [Stentor coeruleus]
MVTILFIFSAPPERVEVTISAELNIESLKSYLLKDLWPSNQIMKEKISCIRLFSMGKELYNDTVLSEIRMPDPGQKVPVLVHPVLSECHHNDCDRERNFCDCIIS